MPRVTIQLSFTFEYDARGEDGWLMEEYSAGREWSPAWIAKHQIRPIEGRPHPVEYRPRPIKKLVHKDRLKARIISQGVFLRRADEDDHRTVAQAMQSDWLSFQPFDEILEGRGDSGRDILPASGGFTFKRQTCCSDEGIYLIIDLGREEAGILELDLTAGAGTVVDIAYGEHLDDLRVRSSVGGRNFANRYICREGRHKFIHYFNRLGCRYLQLNISNIRGKFVLYYAGLIPTEYPVKKRGSFRCPDSLHNRIYDVSVRTLHLCMHEHYEDTPWREQALYTMDSRNQALCGYYCFGEYDFPQACLDLLAKGLKDDGYLELCAPAVAERTIPCYSMAWILELADHLLYSGRREAARHMLPQVSHMLNTYLEGMTEGLFPTPRGDHYWNFYEWAPGLSGDSSVRTNEGQQGVEFDAPLNLFLCMALEAAAWMNEQCGSSETADIYRTRAAELKTAFHREFWDEEKQVYRTYSRGGAKPHYAELTQGLALCAGACPSDKAPLLREQLAMAENGLVKTTLSHSYFKFQALMQDPDSYASIVMSGIEQDWGHMLYQGATSFWETIAGADDFSRAGSLCHGWSAIPVYFYHAHILGVKPVEPGFRKFKVQPVQSVFRHASGVVPTPYGPIEVSWEKIGGKLECNVKNPEGTILC